MQNRTETEPIDENPEPHSTTMSHTHYLGKRN